MSEIELGRAATQRLIMASFCVPPEVFACLEPANTSTARVLLVQTEAKAAGLVADVGTRLAKVMRAAAIALRKSKEKRSKRWQRPKRWRSRHFLEDRAFQAPWFRGTVRSALVGRRMMLLAIKVEQAHQQDHNRLVTGLRGGWKAYENEVCEAEKVIPGTSDVALLAKPLPAPPQVTLNLLSCLYFPHVFGFWRKRFWASVKASQTSQEFLEHRVSLAPVAEVLEKMHWLSWALVPCRCGQPSMHLAAPWRPAEEQTGSDKKCPICRYGREPSTLPQRARSS